MLMSANQLDRRTSTRHDERHRPVVVQATKLALGQLDD